MVFADIGDRISLRESEALGFDIDGPFAEGLATGAENLVVRARDAALDAALRSAPPFHLTLTKRLPIASGIGGGSADAAATLRLLGDRLALKGVEELARGLGSDVPACLRSSSLIAEGRGERLAPAPAIPPLDAVLVNPGVSSPTSAVYGAYDRIGRFGGADRPRLPEVIRRAEEAATLIGACRNDLEAPAVALEPVIGDALDVLRSEPETLLARMSGSGATCFALCAGPIEAETLAERLRGVRPGWWIQSCRLA